MPQSERVGFRVPKEPLRDYRRRMGLCPICGVRPPRTTWACEVCLKESRLTQNPYLRQHRWLCRRRRAYAQDLVRWLNEGGERPAAPRWDDYPKSPRHDYRIYKRPRPRKKRARPPSQAHYPRDIMVIVRLNRYFEKRVKFSKLRSYEDVTGVVDVDPATPRSG